jgi:hypothetical protein
MPRGKRTRSPHSDLLEVSRFFMREGAVYETLRRLAKRLKEERLDYAVLGGMAVVEHGYRRATEDVDLLMRPETLDAFRRRLLGRGYLPAFAGASRTFRDTETGVRLDVVTTGDFPGDGKPKAVSFPDPAHVAVDGDEFRVVRLETLIELKLASGLSAPHRLQDLADVQNLIVRAGLPLGLGDRLDASVRAEYLRLWELARSAPPDGEV